MKALMAQLNEELFQVHLPDYQAMSLSTGGQEPSDDEEDLSRAFQNKDTTDECAMVVNPPTSSISAPTHTEPTTTPNPNTPTPPLPADPNELQASPDDKVTAAANRRLARKATGKGGKRGRK